MNQDNKRPIGETTQAFQELVDQVHTNPYFTDREIIEILNNPDLDNRMKLAKMSGLIWEAMGCRDLTFTQRAKNYQWAHELLDKAARGKLDVFKYPEGPTLPYESPEFEAVVYGIDDKFTHIAMPRQPLFYTGNADIDFLVSKDISSVTLVPAEQRNFQVNIGDPKTMEDARRPNDSIINSNNITMKNGAGALGLIPSIDPKFAEETLGWATDLHRTKTELILALYDLRQTSEIFKINKEGIPLDIDQIATRHSIFTLPSLYMDGTLNSTFVDAGDRHILGTVQSQNDLEEYYNNLRHISKYSNDLTNDQAEKLEGTIRSIANHLDLVEKIKLKHPYSALPSPQDVISSLARYDRLKKLGIKSTDELIGIVYVKDRVAQDPLFIDWREVEDLTAMFNIAMDAEGKLIDFSQTTDDLMRPMNEIERIKIVTHR